MINYLEIVKHSKGNEQLMWESVALTNDFVMGAYEVNPEGLSKFLEEQYELLNGHHFNEWLAKKVVSEMWHTNSKGDVVKGELVTKSASMQVLVGFSAEYVDACEWDAYVAANTFFHDLADTGVSGDNLIKLTAKFWFKDEDFVDGNKIYWYHSNKKGIWK